MSPSLSLIKQCGQKFEEGLFPSENDEPMELVSHGDSTKVRDYHVSVFYAPKLYFKKCFIKMFPAPEIAFIAEKFYGHVLGFVVRL